MALRDRFAVAADAGLALTGRLLDSVVHHLQQEDTWHTNSDFSHLKSYTKAGTVHLLDRLR